MRGFLLVVALLLLAAIGLAALITHDPGYVLLAYGDTTIEMSLWVALAVIALGLLSLWCIWWLTRSVLRPWFAWSGWRARRSSRRQQQRSNAAVLAYTEGHWDEAQKLLEQCARESDEPLMNYLLAARSAFHCGDKEAVGRLLERAEEFAGSEQLPVVLPRAQLQLRDGRSDDALRSLQAHPKAMRHPSGLLMLRDIHQNSKDWNSLQKLLPQLRKSGLLSTNELKRLARSVVIGRLHQTRQDLSETSQCDERVKALSKIWKALDDELRSDAELLRTYCELLIEANQSAVAENILRGFLRADWDEQIIDLYGQCRGVEPLRQLQFAESFVELRADSPGLHMALGRLCLVNDLHGRAREYFLRAAKLGAGADAWLLLGELTSRLGSAQKGGEYFKRGLLQQIGQTDISKLMPVPKKT